jgi:hypothetical protein
VLKTFNTKKDDEESESLPMLKFLAHRPFWDVTHFPPIGASAFAHLSLPHIFLSTKICAVHFLDFSEVTRISSIDSQTTPVVILSA